MSSASRGAGVFFALVLFMVGLGVGLYLRANSTDNSGAPGATSSSVVGNDQDSGTAGGSSDTAASLLGTGSIAGGSFADVATKVAPAVVNVSSERTVVTRERVLSPFGSDPFFDFFGPRYFSIPRQRRESSLGSGVIVAEDGIVLTNNHVIEGADDIQVILAGGRGFHAHLLGTDPATDVAVLKVDTTGLPTVPLGNSDRARIGDLVLAFGNPFGLGQTVTMGIISATGRSELGLVDYENFIQTDAAINPGNSGGALVDTRGRLIGINTAIFSRSGGYQGIGFAVPIDIASHVMQSILATGKIVRGWIGASFQDIDQGMTQTFGLTDQRGALINEITANGPADMAGLKRGDVIVEFEGRPINDYADLKRSIALASVGSEVTLAYLRGGQRHEAKVEVAEEETEYTYHSSNGQSQDNSLEGIVVEELDRRTVERLGLRSGSAGVIVKEILPDSPAERSGLRAGDVILEVNQEAVAGVEEFKRILAKNEGNTVVLLLSRDGALYYLSLPA